MRVLLPFQERILQEAIERKTGLVTLKPGAGKSAIMVKLAEHVFAETAGRTLIVAPCRVAHAVWKREFENWASPLRVANALGNIYHRKVATLSEHQVLVTHYDLFEKILPHMKIGLYAAIILDETSYITRTETKRWQGMKDIFKLFDYRFCLNGNLRNRGGIEELWSQAFVCDLGKRLGPRKVPFLTKWGFTDRFGNWEPNPYKDMSEVWEKMKELELTAPEEEYRQLPDLTETPRYVQYPTALKQRYEKLKAEAAELLLDDSQHNRYLGFTEKLRQLASGFLYGHEGTVECFDEFKLDECCDLAKEIAPCIIVYQHKFMVAELRKRLAAEKLKVAEFRDAPLEDLLRMDVILLHPASAGHGVDGLQDKFSKMIWVQPDWSGDRAAQTIARVWRRGQTAPVHVYWLLSEGTVEEREFLKSESIRENFDLPS